MNENSIKILERALKREKAARKQAEDILEQKSAELFSLTQELQISNMKLEKMVKEKISELKGVFENIIDAYVVMDLSGNVLRMNDAAEQMLEYSVKNEEINLAKLVHPEDHHTVNGAFKHLYDTGAIRNYEVQINTKSGITKLVDINASIIYNDENSPIAAQGIVRDITAIKNLEIQKEKLLKKLEKSNQELEEYAHIVSHDLKSPLRSIYALVDWIKEDNKGKFNKETESNLTLINSTLEKMEQLIFDVLDYSSVTKEKRKKEEVNLNSVINDICKLLYIPDHINISLKTSFPTVMGDRARLQQLFQNLISNALRYIDKKNGLIEIDCKEIVGFYEFSIKDNGIGIEPKYHKKIFQIFQSLHKNKDSTGVGLSIVKKIIESYQGDIWLESELNKGTTFFFTLKK